MEQMNSLEYYLPSLLIGWLFFSIVISIDIIHKIKIQHRLVPLYKFITVGLVYVSFLSLVYIAIFDQGTYQSSVPYMLVIYIPVAVLLITTGHIVFSLLGIVQESGFKSVKKLALTYTLGFAVALMTALIFSMVLKTFLGIEVI